MQLYRLVLHFLASCARPEEFSKKVQAGGGWRQYVRHWSAYSGVKKKRRTDFVAQRVREMAIRLALGAHPSDLLKLVIGKTMLMVVVGLALGGGAALVLPRVLASLLYDASPTDRVTWVVAGALLGTVALLACYFPARRATRVDPLTILRFE